MKGFSGRVLVHFFEPVSVSSCLSQKLDATGGDVFLQLVTTVREVGGITDW